MLHVLFRSSIFFFFIATAPTCLYTLSLHDALPILPAQPGRDSEFPRSRGRTRAGYRVAPPWLTGTSTTSRSRDRKSTRLNSSHVKISYAVFCLKKKKK